MTSIRVMTFNVRGAPEDDGINIWKNRASVNLAVIHSAEPEIIGFQEVQDANLSAYLEELEGYEFEPGPICNRPGRILHNAIFWKSKRFTCEQSGAFYISPTPNRWSRGWDAGRVRLVNWVKLTQIENHQTFFFLNSHMDHIGHQSRLEGSRLILNQLTQFNSQGFPAVLVGDFNSLPQLPAEYTPPSNTETPYQILIHGGFIDTFLETNHHNGRQINTFHDFKGEEFIKGVNSSDWRIDWILLYDPHDLIRIQKSEILRDGTPPIYPSDHYPVIADLDLG
jgi:endonuclease/exonuclease/phosphatase family metal-dependent hydrolase